VTCLVLTRNRRRWLPYALQCARYQTYEPTEILVVSSGEPVADLLPDDIRHVHLAGNPCIGAMRNAGCGAARGDVVAHFDDDDFSDPERLSDQMALLLDSGLAVTGYRSMRFTDGVRSWRYLGSPLFVLGTSLCYRRQWWEQHPFPAIQVGEDNSFVVAAASGRQLAVADDAGDLMFATNHTGNTSPRINLNGSSWKVLP
jgi:glycosyltransferase involved in cell wall biosynthesis